MVYNFIPRLIPPYMRELGISYIHSILIMHGCGLKQELIIPELRACLINYMFTGV